MRQRLRTSLLILAFLSFPVTMNWLSPYLIAAGAAEGIVAGCVLVYAALLLLSTVLGRFFCGWLCPIGGLQEWCARAQGRPVRSRWTDWIKYVIWVPWVWLFVFLAVKAGGLRKVLPLFMFETGVSVDTPLAYVRYYFVIVLVLALAFSVGRRAFCHSGCWIAPFMVIGRAASNVVRAPGLRLRVTGECRGCKACTAACPMSLDVTGMATRGSMENSECVLCGSCVDTCPNGTLSYTFGRPVYSEREGTRHTT